MCDGANGQPSVGLADNPLDFKLPTIPLDVSRLHRIPGYEEIQYHKNSKITVYCSCIFRFDLDIVAYSYIDNLKRKIT